MSKARQREVRALIKAADLECVELHLRGGGHIGATVRRPSDGEQKLFIFSLTPSDRRGDLNKLAMLRRFARGVQYNIAGQAPATA